MTENKEPTRRLRHIKKETNPNGKTKNIQQVSSLAINKNRELYNFDHFIKNSIPETFRIDVLENDGKLEPPPDFKPFECDQHQVENENLTCRLKDFSLNMVDLRDKEDAAIARKRFRREKKVHTVNPTDEFHDPLDDQLYSNFHQRKAKEERRFISADRDKAKADFNDCFESLTFLGVNLKKKDIYEKKIELDTRKGFAKLKNVKSIPKEETKKTCHSGEHTSLTGTTDNNKDKQANSNVGAKGGTKGKGKAKAKDGQLNAQEGGDDDDDKYTEEELFDIERTLPFITKISDTDDRLELVLKYNLTIRELRSFLYRFEELRFKEMDLKHQLLTSAPEMDDADVVECADLKRRRLDDRNRKIGRIMKIKFPDGVILIIDPVSKPTIIFP
ncbi:unnamed protein product [Ambrosiozyma monospora]|uniref:Unnamed protein product n=1 Tax=Ambrosiozyma monospora TaxID=43982 RepID=A0A9W6Z572_AMBMO|nr:unnamed protein product [Ambrosiozyma monospora]